MKVKAFSLARYVEAALKKAEYFRDENGMVIARVPRHLAFSPKETPLKRLARTSGTSLRATCFWPCNWG
jgi:hypothetical protein